MKKSILTRTVLFILLLCVFLSVLQYKSNQSMLYSQYESSIGGILRYAAEEIDEDDLAECIRTGEESAAYHELQAALDKLKENLDVHFIYVIVPLNTEAEDNIKNVIAGATRYEYEYEADEIVRLNSLTGDSYSPEAAQRYLTAYNSGELSFFESNSEWGDDYTGLLPLFDSAGNPVAALCVDVDIAEINAKLRNCIIESILLIVMLGMIFVFIFISWTERKISEPIELLESSVVEFASQCRNQKNPEALEIDVPVIHTNNELEMLRDAVAEMSEAIREYVMNIRNKESELARMAMLLNKDALTMVRNKNAFNSFIREHEAKISEGKETPFALLIANLNGLKNVNEICGRAKGDEYIKKGCRAICRIFSHSPVFRIGGDEFAIFLSGQSYEERADYLKQAKRVFQEMEQDESLPLWERCSVAFGEAAYQPGTGASLEDVFNQAENSMYEENERMKKTL